MPEINSIVAALGGREKLELALKENLDWLLKSFQVNKGAGSSGTRTMRGSWGAVYPETTGYLIPTVYHTADYFDNEEGKAMAMNQLAFLESIENEDGSYKQSIDIAEPIVFDTAQILHGLLFYSSMVAEPEPMLKRTRLTADWLGLQLDEEGNFISHNYVDDYNPAYYARIAWAMASAELIKYSRPRTKTKTLIKRLGDMQNQNYSFSSWGFYPDEPGLTHTIAYTLRGLWECGEILNDRKLKKKVRMSLNRLSSEISEHGAIAASYDQEWKGDYSYICAVGNAQLALLYLILFEKSGSRKFLTHIELLLKPLLKKQKTILMNKGAIPSSIPMKGKYQRFKYTNWTQKFFCDALLRLLQLAK